MKKIPLSCALLLLSVSTSWSTFTETHAPPSPRTMAMDIENTCPDPSSMETAFEKMQQKAVDEGLKEDSLIRQLTSMSDKEKAIYILKPGAEQGHIVAQCALGLVYRSLGMRSLARQWHLKAAYNTSKSPYRFKSMRVGITNTAATIFNDRSLIFLQKNAPFLASDIEKSRQIFAKVDEHIGKFYSKEKAYRRLLGLGRHFLKALSDLAPMEEGDEKRLLKEYFVTSAEDFFMYATITSMEKAKKETFKEKYLTNSLVFGGLGDQKEHFSAPFYYLALLYHCPTLHDDEIYLGSLRDSVRYPATRQQQINNYIKDSFDYMDYCCQEYVDIYYDLGIAAQEMSSSHAKMWFQKAADFGYKKAQDALGDMLTKDFSIMDMGETKNQETVEQRFPSIFQATEVFESKAENRVRQKSKRKENFRDHNDNKADDVLEKNIKKMTL